MSNEFEKTAETKAISVRNPRHDVGLRVEALDQAIRLATKSETTEAIVKRAEAFAEFLIKE